MKRILWVFFAASVCFNVFFAVGYMKARADAVRLKSHEGRAQILSEELSLTDAQRDAFIEFRQRVGGRFAQLRRNTRDGDETFWKEIQNPDLTPEEVHGLIEYVFTENQALVKYWAEAVHEYLKTLNPEQRAAYIRQVRRWDWAAGLLIGEFNNQDAPSQ